MKDHIRAEIKNALSTLTTEVVDFVVDWPTDKNTDADYFTNVAMVAAPLLKQSPVEIAKAIVYAFNSERVTAAVAGPGFINFSLKAEFFTEELSYILAAGGKWGRNDSWRGKRVVVEYTDPNPFKEFHVGHLFTNAVGESIARLFMMNGAETKRVNYQGDVGLHVAHAIWGMQQLDLKGDEVTPQELGKAYALGATTYKNDGIAAAAIREINKKIYNREDSGINALYDLGRHVSLAYFESIYALVDTQFDEYFFESEAGPRGKEVVLSNPKIFPESDGARIYNGEAKGLHTRVFLNREGLPTYEAKELALAQLKEERLGVYDHSVISTANEIKEYFKVLLSALEEVSPELAAKTEHIGHGMVRLTTGKMSSRTGDVIPAMSFINEVANSALTKMEESSGVVDRETAMDVAIGAIKYATLRSNISQDSIFDKDQALSFEGDSGPYLQYTHARICSVLTKAGEDGVQGSTQLPPPQPYQVQKLLSRFPTIVEAALAERAPHKVTGYLTELAGAFNTFYANEKIADPEDKYAAYKAAVATAVKLTLKNGLWILAIKAPERM